MQALAAAERAEGGVCADETREGSTYGKVRLPNLKVAAVLRSQQPRDTRDITIITQCSLDRSVVFTAAYPYWPVTSVHSSTHQSGLICWLCTWRKSAACK